MLKRQYVHIISPYMEYYGYYTKCNLVGHCNNTDNVVDILYSVSNGKITASINNLSWNNQHFPKEGLFEFKELDESIITVLEIINA